MAKKLNADELYLKQSKIGKSNVRCGKSHERRIANLFTEWSGEEFRRRKVEGRDDATLWVNSAADVIPVRSDFLFSIEAKKGAGFSLDALMANPTKCLFKTWWFQTCYDAQLISSIRNRRILPLLFFKPNPQNDWIAFSTKSIDLLQPKSNIERLTNNLWFPHLLFDHYEAIGPISGDVSHSPKHPKFVTMQLDNAVICRWKDFAYNVDPKPLLLSHNL